MITDYLGGEGSAETPKNDYVIYGWPLNCPQTGNTALSRSFLKLKYLFWPDTNVPSLYHRPSPPRTWGKWQIECPTSLTHYTHHLLPTNFSTYHFGIIFTLQNYLLPMFFSSPSYIYPKKYYCKQQPIPIHSLLLFIPSIYNFQGHL